MTLTFFNVGYGEAVLVECPDPARPRGRFVMLLDGGSGEAEEFPSELPQRAPLIRELERMCAEELPEYVQPVAYKFISSMPMTPVGKFDYRKLETEITSRDY